MVSGCSFTDTRVVANNVELNSRTNPVGITLNNSTLAMGFNSAWSSGNINLNNSTLENFGVFLDQTNNSILAPAGVSRFLNDASGLYAKTATSNDSPTLCQAAFWNSGNFLLNGFSRTFTGGFYQSSGTVSLGGGTLGLGNNQNYWLFGGLLLAEDGSITGGDLINTGGTLDVSCGLILTGNYQQWADATLLFNPYLELGNTSPPFLVTGSAQLNGTLTMDPLLASTTESGTKATVLGSGGGLLGAFTTIPAGWSLVYEGGNVFLEKD